MKLVGKVREAHGLKGDLYVLIFSGDISWAKKMKSFGAYIDLPVLDHIIVADKTYYSFADNGLV